VVSWSFTTIAVAAKNVMTSVPDYLLIETAFTVVQWVMVAPLTVLAFPRPVRDQTQMRWPAEGAFIASVETETSAVERATDRGHLGPKAADRRRIIVSSRHEAPP